MQFVDYVELNPRTLVPRDTVVPFVPMESLRAGARWVRSDEQRRVSGSSAKFRPGDVLFARIMSGAPRLAHGLQLAYDLIGAALFAIILITTWPLAEQAFVNREFYGSTGVVQIPTGPLKAIMIVGCAAMVVQFCLLAWHDLRIALGRSRPAVSTAGD